MALFKAKSLETGFEANYWKIALIEINAVQSRAVIELFKDSAARLDGKEPILRKDFVFSGLENPCSVAALESASAFVLLYDKIKALPEFDGASDV